MLRLAILGLLSPLLSAQSPTVPLLELEHVERQWPTSLPGVDTHLAIGTFVAGHPGRGAAVVRDGQLHLLFEPAHMEHFEATGCNDIGAIATLPSVDSGPDLLAAATPSGLRILRYTTSGFVDALAGQTTLAGWVGARDLRVARFPSPGLPSRYLLGRAQDWVRVSMVDDSGTVSAPVVLPAPSGVTVLAADLVDWVAGGLPEVAVLLSTGTVIMDAAGTPLFWQPQTAISGRLKALRRADGPMFTQIRNTGSSWRVETFRVDGTGTTQYFDGGDLAVQQPVTGFSELEVDGDEYPDIIVSTGESLRRILMGTATGPSAATVSRVDLYDVDDLPMTQPSNKAELQVDDIDRDGLDDLVICQRPTDRLVVIRRMPQQVFALMNGNGSEPEPEAEESLSFLASLGYRAGPMESPDFDGSQGVFGVRLQLPAVIDDGTALDAIVYRVTIKGQSPDAYDPTSLTAIEHYRYPLGSTDGGKQLDVLVPIDIAELPPTIDTLARFVFEFSIVDASGNNPLDGSEPLFIACGLQDGTMAWPQYAATLNPLWELIWWYMELVYTGPNWFTNALPTSGGATTEVPVDARYVGSLTPLKGQRSEGAPSVPPAQTGSALAH